VDLAGSYLARSAAEQASTPSKPLAFSLRTAGLMLNRTAQTLAPAKVEVKVGDSQLLVSVAGEKLSAQRAEDRAITGSVAVPATSARKLLQSLGIAPPITRDSRALSEFALQTNFRLSGKQLQLTALQLTLDDTRVQGIAHLWIRLLRAKTSRTLRPRRPHLRRFH
jgi:uncharacterized protein involved in outer membrane biogenesis